ncbi:heterokaryon incompatibility protein-domain-containing protein [Podospora aff. communis PSN243]|uniref:Heterokaryon incompatibility protein-domain-containing protein n=1 Tax=Podospora aff. communis PSN243 TaxID=3040156 RepID=A0AAV9GED4_9PEZI|nr:heterokaryon incompatibility protein-domain-containing protein [Podospora aff. communis PSN243]
MSFLFAGEFRFQISTWWVCYEEHIADNVSVISQGASYLRHVSVCLDGDGDENHGNNIEPCDLRADLLRTLANHAVNLEELDIIYHRDGFINWPRFSSPIYGSTRVALRSDISWTDPPLQLAGADENEPWWTGMQDEDAWKIIATNFFDDNPEPHRVFFGIDVLDRYPFFRGAQRLEREKAFFSGPVLKLLQSFRSTKLHTLRALDDGGIDYDTVMAACSIVTGNTSTGFLATRVGARLEPIVRPDDGILGASEYFFQLPDEAASQPATSELIDRDAFSGEKAPTRATSLTRCVGMSQPLKAPEQDADRVTEKEPYQYKKLEPGKNIRLLHLDSCKTADGHLTGDLKAVDLKSRPKYTALSYVWGQPPPSTADPHRRVEHQIKCRSGTISITKNCHDALIDLRTLHGNIVIWVDSICINQLDNHEKGPQIGLMLDIYAQAQVVYVWLGPGSTESSQAIDSLSRASRFVPAFPGIPWQSGSQVRTLAGDSLRTVMSMAMVDLRLGSLNPFTNPRRRAQKVRANLNLEGLGHLLNREWLGRAWTFQEIILSSNATIVCGTKAIAWDRLHRGLHFLMEDEGAGGPEAAVSKARPVPTRAWMNLLNIWLSMPRRTGGMLNGSRNGPQRSAQSYWEGFFSRAGLLIGSKFLQLLFSLVPGVVISAVGLTVWPTDAAQVGTPQIIQIVLAVVGTAIASGGIGMFAALTYGGLKKLQSPGSSPRLMFDVGAPGRPRTSTPRVGIVEALRERNATNPLDKAFALHGVLRLLNDDDAVSGLEADYAKNTREAYRELFTALVRQRPSFVNLLVDAPMGSGRQPEKPTWVPDWEALPTKGWLPPEYVYDPIDGDRAPKPPRLTSRELTLQGVVLDTAALCFDCQPKRPSSDQDAGAEHGPSPPSAPGQDTEVDKLLQKLLPILGMLHQWLQHSRTFTRAVDKAYDSFPKAVLYTLLGRVPADDDEDAKGFDAWYAVMLGVRRPYSDTMDKKAVEEGLRENQEALNFAARCVGRLEGKRGVFFSKEGRIGSGPPTVAGGDKIVVLDGVAVPMVVCAASATGSGPARYTVVGPAFIPGLMKWQMEEYKPSEAEPEVADIVLV